MNGQYYEFLRAQDYIMAGVNIILFAGFLVGAWALFNRLTVMNDHVEMYSRGNTALVWRRLGLVGGQALALINLFSQPYAQWWHDLLWVTLGGVAITALMFFLDFMTDGMGDTLAPSVLRSSFYVAVGFVVGAGFSGSAPSVWTGVIATFVFSVLGIAVLVGVYLLNDLFFGVRRHVSADRVPAAVLAGGFMVSFGLILRNAIAGDFHGWGAAFAGFFITALVALVVFSAVGAAVDRWILTETTLADVAAGNSIAPAASLAVFQLAIALGVIALPIW